MLLRDGKVEMIGEPHEVGNLYIEQNMSDEERRMMAEEKAKRKEMQAKQREEEEHQKRLSRNQQKEAEQQRQKELKEAEEREKNKVARITRVEYLDGNGNAKSTFKTGDDITVRVYFEVLKHVNQKFNFGVGVYNSQNIYFTGINTEISGFSDTELFVKRGYFDLLLKNVSLRKDSYYIKASISNERVTTFYDFLEKSDESFHVFPIDQLEGLMHFEFKWK